MKLIVGGLQGSGRKTFGSRAETYGVNWLDTYPFYLSKRFAVKHDDYGRTAGPHRKIDPAIRESQTQEYKEHMPFFVEELNGIAKDASVIITDLFLLDFICDKEVNDVHTILVTADNDDAAQRIYNMEKLTDPRLIGKKNSYELVKPEIIKELTSYNDLLSGLENKVDTHIVNNGTLEQYHATIDNLLNEHNLLN